MWWAIVAIVYHLPYVDTNLRSVMKVPQELWYRIGGKFGEFGKSSVIHQTKTIQISTYN